MLSFLGVKTIFFGVVTQYFEILRHYFHMLRNNFCNHMHHVEIFGHYFKTLTHSSEIDRLAGAFSIPLAKLISSKPVTQFILDGQK